VFYEFTELQYSSTTLRTYRWSWTRKSGTCTDGQLDGTLIRQCTMIGVEKSGKNRFRSMAQQPFKIIQKLSVLWNEGSTVENTLQAHKRESDTFLPYVWRHGWHDKTLKTEWDHTRRLYHKFVSPATPCAGIYTCSVNVTTPTRTRTLPSVHNSYSYVADLLHVFGVHIYVNKYADSSVYKYTSHVCR
jgi:hypothetical protein